MNVLSAVLESSAYTKHTEDGMLAVDVRRSDVDNAVEASRPSLHTLVDRNICPWCSSDGHLHWSYTKDDGRYGAATVECHLCGCMIKVGPTDRHAEDYQTVIESVIISKVAMCMFVDSTDTI